jgi:hypothetical protein
MFSMKFSQLRKTLKLETVKDVYIPLEQIKSQYNTDLHHHWENVCGDSYLINSTPYYDYLANKRLNNYIKLMRLYRRDKTWITNNISKFIQLSESIKEYGYQGDLPVVLEKPIAENPYNDGYEIWEGHRRLSICLFYGIRQEVRLCRIV